MNKDLCRNREDIERAHCEAQNIHGEWPPRASAFDLDEGTIRFGSTGQRWVVRDKHWVHEELVA